MPDIVKIIGTSGYGDAFLSLQCAYYVFMAGKYPHVLICARDSVFFPLQHTFRDIFKLEQLPEEYSENDRIIHDKDLLSQIKGNCEEIYYCKPDLLFRNNCSFDCYKYNTNYHAIKTTRLLTKQFKPQKNKIYLGLISSTPGYSYRNIPKLACELARELTECEFHFPILDNWANVDVKYKDLETYDFPANLKIYCNDKFENQVDLITTCDYGIYTDCGPNHLSFHLAQNRLILDPQFDRKPWIARWRQSIEDCININTSITDIVNLVKQNIRIPQTTLIPKQAVLNILHRTSNNPNWSQELIFKY